MRTRQQLQRHFKGVLYTVVCVATLLLSPAYASAQGQSDNPDQSSFLADVAKRVFFDPTTYAPAILGYDSTMRDWKSSQPLFQHGYLEANERYTVSGRRHDVPVSFAQGNQRILSDSLLNLPMSFANNASSRVVERLLIDRFPNHPKLVRTLGWIERTSFASYMSYRLSAKHFRQWQTNESLARELGYK